VRKSQAVCLRFFLKNFKSATQEEKKMTKIPRMHIEGALYYVTSRGDHNENIFKDDNDYKAYLELLKKYQAQYGFKIFSFVLMPNHLHLLIELKEGITISQVMHDLNSNYTKYFNGRYQRKGHLFQERYKMVLVEKEPYLLGITAYIHLNPKALNLASDIKDYPYSSYLSYLYYTAQTKTEVKIDLNITAEIQEVMKHLGAKTYQDFIKEVSQGEMEALAGNLNKKSILGSEGFVERVKTEVENYKSIAVKVPNIKSPVTQYILFILGGTLVVIYLGISIFSLYDKNVNLKGRLTKELNNKEQELAIRVMQEKNKITKDLDEKYQADMVSYEALTKRLELEKKKTKELEGKVKSTDNPEGKGLKE
jgi:REP element-mobilizing transposase RayT